MRRSSSAKTGSPSPLTSSMTPSVRPLRASGTQRIDARVEARGVVEARGEARVLADVRHEQRRRSCCATQPAMPSPGLDAQAEQLVATRRRPRRRTTSSPVASSMSRSDQLRGLKQLAHLGEDELHHLADVERRRQRLADLVEDRRARRTCSLQLAEQIFAPHSIKSTRSCRGAPIPATGAGMTPPSPRSASPAPAGVPRAARHRASRWRPRTSTRPVRNGEAPVAYVLRHGAREGRGGGAPRSRRRCSRADTFVVKGRRKMLGKPRDESDCERMMRLLSGARTSGHHRASAVRRGQRSRRPRRRGSSSRG